MIQDIYLKDGTLLASRFNRIVHGERGDYVEFELNDIILPLVSKFNNIIDLNNPPKDIYYYWLHPANKPEFKIYLQLKTVKYADYKIGKLYISPYLLKDFKDPETLFNLYEL